MADPLSITSGVIAIVTAALQASKTLYETVQSFRNHQRTVKQLLAELAALSDVLESLESLASQDETMFLPLKRPLVQCRQACSAFGALMLRCSRHSGGSRTSFRDWAKLRYMDSNIAGFTGMLAGYKSTISIALADANLRATTVTLQVLNEYKDMICSTTQDLEDHLGELEAKLQTVTIQNGNTAGTMNTEFLRIKTEKDSAENCLEICNLVLHRINEIRFQPVTETQASGRSHTTQSWTEAEAMTLSALTACSSKLTETVSHLQALKDNADRKQGPHPSVQSHSILDDPGLDLHSLEGELEGVRQCLAICNGAATRAQEHRVHVLENIRTGHGGQQIFVSTLGDLFHVKGVSAGDGAIQFIGSVSDSTLQEFFRLQNNR